MRKMRKVSKVLLALVVLVGFTAYAPAAHADAWDAMWGVNSGPSVGYYGGYGYYGIPKVVGIITSVALGASQLMESHGNWRIKSAAARRIDTESRVIESAPRGPYDPYQNSQRRFYYRRP